MGRTKEEYEADLSPREVFEFIRRSGAVSQSEIKKEFEANSRPVRRAIAKLLWHNKVWLLAHGRGVYLAENTGQKGAPSVKKLRQAAGTSGGLPGRKKGSSRNSTIPGLDKLSPEARELVMRDLGKSERVTEVNLHNDYE